MLLHLALESDWFDALAAGHYPVSTRGATVDEVGFLHTCRDMAQLHAVVARFYDDESAPLVILVIDPDLLPAGYEVRHEPDPGSVGGGSADTYPHVYGGVLPVSAVVDVRQFGGPHRHTIAQLDAGLASPYPSTRDGWAAAEVADGIREGRFTREELFDLGHRAQKRLAARDVHARAGAQSLLARLADAGVSDRSSYAAATASLLAERDTRGYDPRVGRLGAISCGVDYQARAVVHGIASPAEVLATLARRMVTEDTAVWTQGEDARVAHAMVAALAVPGCSPADAVSWTPIVRGRLTALAARADGPDPAWLTNTRTALTSLHTALAEQPLVDGEPVHIPFAGAVRAACADLLAAMTPWQVAPRLTP